MSEEGPVIDNRQGPIKPLGQKLPELIKDRRTRMWVERYGTMPNVQREVTRSDEKDS